MKPQQTTPPKFVAVVRGVVVVMAGWLVGWRKNCTYFQYKIQWFHFQSQVACQQALAWLSYLNVDGCWMMKMVGLWLCVGDSSNDDDDDDDVWNKQHMNGGKCHLFAHSFVCSSFMWRLGWWWWCRRWRRSCVVISMCRISKEMVEKHVLFCSMFVFTFSFHFSPIQSPQP